ncbi:MAG: Rne/Rng family ribonuclease, partial [Planctomycetota bacterium]
MADEQPTATTKKTTKKTTTKKTTTKKASSKKTTTKKTTKKASSSRSASSGGARTRTTASDTQPPSSMIVNYVPGEECRIAFVSEGKLEEYDAERPATATSVGNIYLGTVTNVESAIQAAFVDFGHESNGFLHTSDLHPQYFPGEDEETTETIGKKTARRDRPPIQKCLKRGQKVLVQVIKEGIGTKGPTVTSYLSIPGRYLVMLPQMDKVGVSRKVEDDDLRRKGRKILDELDLPEGFGFILRTAGLEQTKAELKRDLSYLKRLWSDIEKRLKKANNTRQKRGDMAGRLLFAESDLLMRVLRDRWASDVREIIIDHPAALSRAARFMKIVAPRSATQLLHYDQPTPVFHAFGIEEQIQRMHEREVPLPGGGSLVIDETEAMIAIDVNSGKNRRHGDAETTAFETNKQAVDEICRQLRLRDIGGLVVCDLIDMMKRSHRKEIENRIEARLKRDRAASKSLPISQFGMVEMTRQRMRGSLRSQHFTTCPACAGRGLVRRPASVAADTIRDIAALLNHERVGSVEVVISPRVAGELLSAGRLQLTRLEHKTGKSVQVRVKEDMQVDRVIFYAYDEQGADIALEKLPAHKPPKELPIWDEQGGDDELEHADEIEQLDDDALADREEEDDAMLEAMPGIDEPEPTPASDTEEELDEDGNPKKKRRRRRRGGRGRRRRSDDEQRDGEGEAEESVETAVEEADEAPRERASDEDEEGEGEGGRKRRRRRRRRGGRRSEDGEGDTEQSESGRDRGRGRGGRGREVRDADAEDDGV